LSGEREGTRQQHGRKRRGPFEVIKKGGKGTTPGGLIREGIKRGCGKKKIREEHTNSSQNDDTVRWFSGEKMGLRFPSLIGKRIRGGEKPQTP